MFSHMSNSIATLLGVAFSAGLNIYATVLALGVLHRLEMFSLPDSLVLLASTPVMIAAAILYIVEFVADKIPWVDSIWDAVHTVIRPIGGALIAVASVGHVSPEMEAIVALAGAGLATSSHLTKAGTRAAANTSPEPFSNWILSFSEDGFVIGLAILALNYPVAAAIVVLIALAIILAMATWLVRGLRRTLFAPER